MSTHPVEPDPVAPQREPSAPNTSHLPVEPEFGPVDEPMKPEDPAPPRSST